jgi:hypothetical protein
MDATAVAEAHHEELRWEDRRFLAWAASRLAVPREGPADSFVLHASLELLARAALLDLVPAPARERARLRIAALVDRYEAADDPAGPPGEGDPDDGDDPAALADRLVAAIGRSDLPTVDRLAARLGARATAADLLRLLGPAVAPLTGAAAHAPIGLHLLGRSPAIDGTVLRGCLRELAREPGPPVPVDGLARGDAPLADALLAVPRVGPTVGEFIRPMVGRGTAPAARLLADVSDDASAASRAVGRVAALAMVQEADDNVPYGWTHALTIPQAVLSLGLDGRTAVAVAGTQLAGFLASMGSRPLDPDRPPPDVPEAAVPDLVTWAALHDDAHVVKYTLASLDAARADPEAAGLHRAAVARLAGWWAAQGGDGFFPPGDRFAAYPGGGPR